MSLRKVVRDPALKFAQTGLAIAGLKNRLRHVPGQYVLLLHNTIGGDADNLIRYIDKNRDLFVDFPRRPTAQAALTHRQISLSFDDGFCSNLPVGRALAERGLSAAFYVPTDVVGMSKDASDRFFGRQQAEGVMSWDDLEELRDLGHRIGSHCKRHIPLTKLSTNEAEDQIRASLQVLRDRLGTVEHFAWPFGSLSYAPVEQVVTWCAAENVTAASGVRGSNSAELFASEQYLRRDAVDPSKLARDVEVFLGIDSLNRSRRNAE